MRNRFILATPVINVSITPQSSEQFLAMNSPTLNFKLAFLETKIWGKKIEITSYFKGELQSLKKESSDKTKNASHNSNNSKVTNAPQDNNKFDQNLQIKKNNGILLLESEKRSLKDDVAKKQRFVKTLLNFNESNILSHSITTSSKII